MCSLSVQCEQDLFLSQEALRRLGSVLLWCCGLWFFSQGGGQGGCSVVLSRRGRGGFSFPRSLVTKEKSFSFSEGSIFIHTSVLTSHWCDSVPQITNLKLGESHFHHKFRDFSPWLARSAALGPVSWHRIILGHMWWKKMLSLWHLWEEGKVKVPFSPTRALLQKQ